MAAIDDYIAQIQAAVYGEEVRGSIVNALNAMNTESSTAKSAAQTAQDSATAKAQEAATSATTASQAATTATTKAAEANTAATNASTSELNAASSASSASSAATLAESSKTDAQSYMNSALNAAASAETNATSASTDAAYIREHLHDADTAATNAADSAASAHTSATNAASSESIASNAATSASNYASTASSASSDALNYKNIAETQATNAASSATTASTAATNAASSATTASEKANEAKGYYQSIGSGISYICSLVFSELPSIADVQTGWMYTITDAYTTTSDFAIGSGTPVSGGNSVIKNSNGKWDIKYNPETSIDDVVTRTSSNPVKSSGIYNVIQNKQDVLTFDNIPIANSDNPVKSSGIYSALQNKQNTLTIDSNPSSGSTNPVESGGVYNALQNKQNTLTFDNIPIANSDNPVKSGGIYSALQNKQNTLTFDSAPTANSTNPVTSGGIKTYAPFRFGVDSNGKYGYIKDGADTVTPFKGDPNLQSKSVSPSTSAQTVAPDSGYDGLSSVSVGAIQTQTKSVTPSSSSQTITPDSGKYLSSVSVGAVSLTSLDCRGIRVIFEPYSKSESISYDYVDVIGHNGSSYVYARVGGNSTWVDCVVPTHGQQYIYIYWHTDSSSHAFFGFKIAAIVPAYCTSPQGGSTGTYTSLPKSYDATVTLANSRTIQSAHQYLDNTAYCWRVDISSLQMSTTASETGYAKTIYIPTQNTTSRTEETAVIPSSETITSAKTYSAGYYANDWTVTPQGSSATGNATPSQVLSGYTFSSASYPNGASGSITTKAQSSFDMPLNKSNNYYYSVTFPSAYYSNSWTVNAALDISGAPAIGYYSITLSSSNTYTCYTNCYYIIAIAASLTNARKLTYSSGAPFNDFYSGPTGLVLAHFYKSSTGTGESYEIGVSGSTTLKCMILIIHDEVISPMLVSETP